MFFVRPETGSGRVQCTTIADAISRCVSQQQTPTVIEWQTSEHTCCLDIDFPENAVPKETQLLAFTATIEPRPKMYWLSRSGGVHLIYETDDIFSADEFAAVAAYHFLRRYPQCLPELLHRTRNPPASVYITESSVNVEVLRTLLQESETGDDTLYIQSKGWSIGERYEHVLCPVNPSVRGVGNTNPVVVHSDHVYCYICAKDGRRCGSKTPGWFPYAALTGSRIETMIARAVNNFVHWSHAKQILCQRISNEHLARKIYSSLLKLKYPYDTRIPLVFTAGEPFGLVRYPGYWCDYEGTTLKIDKSSSILSTLPQTKYCDRVGNLTEIPDAREWLAQTINLSMKGYTPVTPLQGFHFSKWQELPDNKLFAPLRIATIPEDRQPRYLADRDRYNLPRAWQTLETIYPGINQTVILALLVARGCIEHRSGMPPMLFLTGPTGSGKTGHVQLAANIAGDTVSTVNLQRDTDRFYNELLTAKRRSGFVFFDEFFKSAKAAQMSNVQAMEMLLSFDPNKLIYLIYIGSVPLGELPALIWANDHIPVEVLAHEQVGRRVFQYKMERTLTWEDTLKDSGVGLVPYTRERASMEVVRSMNTILSHVIDEYFLTPVTDFATVMGTLGISKINQSEHAKAGQENIQEFITALRNATDERTDADKKRWPGDSWRVFRTDKPSTLQQTFTILQTQEEFNTINCRALSGTDLGFELVFRQHGNTIAVRIK